MECRIPSTPNSDSHNPTIPVSFSFMLLATIVYDRWRWCSCVHAGACKDQMALLIEFIYAPLPQLTRSFESTINPNYFIVTFGHHPELQKNCFTFSALVVLFPQIRRRSVVSKVAFVQSNLFVMSFCSMSKPMYAVGVQAIVLV